LSGIAVYIQIDRNTQDFIQKGPWVMGSGKGGKSGKSGKGEKGEKGGTSGKRKREEREAEHSSFVISSEGEKSCPRFRSFRAFPAIHAEILPWNKLIIFFFLYIVGEN
jgi:hypothetical protein